MQCSHVIQTLKHENYDEFASIWMLFSKVAARLHTKTAGKHKPQILACSLTSENRYLDALTHNSYFYAYSGLRNTLKIHLNNLCVWFGSCKDRRLNQSTAVIPALARRKERVSRSEFNPAVLN